MPAHSSWLVSWSVAACLQKGSASPLLRRSSLSLLTEIGPVRETLPQLKTLMADEDPEIALLACKLRLTQAPAICDVRSLNAARAVMSAIGR